MNTPEDIQVMLKEKFCVDHALPSVYHVFFGAVCPAKDRARGLVLPTIGMGCMQMHLEEIAKEVDPGNHAVIVFDSAAWHTIKLRFLINGITLRILFT